MAKNLLALVGMWAIINHLIAFLPASFFQIFKESQGMTDTVETVNNRIQVETGLKFTNKPIKKPPEVRGGSREDDCRPRLLINEMVNDKAQSCD